MIFENAIFRTISAFEYNDYFVARPSNLSPSAPQTRCRDARDAMFISLFSSHSILEIGHSRHPRPPRARRHSRRIAPGFSPTTRLLRALRQKFIEACDCRPSRLIISAPSRHVPRHFLVILARADLFYLIEECHDAVAYNFASLTLSRLSAYVYIVSEDSMLLMRWGDIGVSADKVLQFTVPLATFRSGTFISSIIRIFAPPTITLIGASRRCRRHIGAFTPIRPR